MLLESVKRELRISNTAYDEEVQSIIDAALLDLRIPQIKESSIVESDPLIKRAVILYCKANFGLDNPDSEKYQRSYDNLAQKLSLSLMYKDVE